MRKWDIFAGYTKTNYDRIMEMSDEELAHFLWNFEKEEVCTEDECLMTLRKLLEWLRQPAE